MKDLQMGLWRLREGNQCFSCCCDPLSLCAIFVVVAQIYPPVTGQRQQLTYWTIRTIFIAMTTS